ncbi:hypothetical protein GCM10009780_44950 [Actinomadura alba]
MREHMLLGAIVTKIWWWSTPDKYAGQERFETFEEAKAYNRIANKLIATTTTGRRHEFAALQLICAVALSTGLLLSVVPPRVTGDRLPAQPLAGRTDLARAHHRGRGGLHRLPHHGAPHPPGAAHPTGPGPHPRLTAVRRRHGGLPRRPDRRTGARSSDPRTSDSTPEGAFLCSPPP